MLRQKRTKYWQDVCFLARNVSFGDKAIKNYSDDVTNLTPIEAHVEPYQQFPIRMQYSV